MKVGALCLVTLVLYLISIFACGEDESQVDQTGSSGASSLSSNSVAVSASSSSYTVPSLSQVMYRDLVSVSGPAFVQNATDGGSFAHAVSSFRMGKYEVTYELWHTVCVRSAKNGYLFSNAGREGHDGEAGAAPTGDKFEPVTTMTWRDAMVWCNAYSQLDGLIPVYYTTPGFTTPLKDSRDGSFDSSINTAAGGFDNPYIKWNATGYRLPTEGEWQYAAAYGGNSHTCASGATAAYTNAVASGEVAWYSANSGSRTRAVGTRTANQAGIHDMSGNVWEWCHDWAGAWPASTQSDYRGPASGYSRIYRGGCYAGSALSLQTGYRADIGPFNKNISLGFRVVRID